VKNVFDAEHCGEKTDRQTDVQTDRQNYCKISNVCKTEEYILHLMHLFFHRKFKLTMRIRVIVTFSGFFCVLRRSRSFKMTHVSTNRKPVSDFLFVMNTNRHPISYSFKVMANYCSNYGHYAFFELPLGA